MAKKPNKKKTMKKKRPKKKRRTVGRTGPKRLNPDLELDIVLLKKRMFKLVAKLHGEEEVGFAVIRFRKRWLSKKLSGGLYIESKRAEIGVPRFLIN